MFMPFARLSIPARDYRGWNRDHARVISAVDSSVVVRPNALPQHLKQFASVISASVDPQKASGKTHIYLDAGHKGVAAGRADGRRARRRQSRWVSTFRSTAEFGEAPSPMIVRKP